MDRTLIICRYGEDISWLRDLKGYNIIIYDKGDPNAPYHLPNFGREAHAYIHHIIQNYDNLSTMNVFCQASPFMHSDNFVEKLHKVSPKSKYAGLADMTLIAEKDEWFDWGGRGLDDEKYRISIEQFFDRLFPGYRCPKSFDMRVNGLFAVHKDRIRYRSLAFYKEIYKDFETEWTLPYLLERFWHLILAGPLFDQICLKTQP